MVERKSFEAMEEAYHRAFLIAGGKLGSFKGVIYCLRLFFASVAQLMLLFV